MAAIWPAFHPFLAHAFGKRYELPIPLWLFVVGGGLVVLISFAFVLPRPAGDHPADVSDDAPNPGVFHHRLWQSLSLLLFLYVLYAGWFGSQELAENIVPTLFWLVVWVAVPITCGLVGNWTSPFNVFALATKLGDRPGLRAALSGSAEPITWPGAVAFWPATVVFFVAACGELVFNGVATLPAVTASGLAVYFLVCTVGGFLFGSVSWMTYGEMFSLLFSTWGRLGFFRFGAAGKRGFCGGLRAAFAATPSRITFVLLLLTSVSFDGLLSTPAWKSWHDSLPLSLGTGGTFEAIDVATFVALVAAGWLLFGAFAVAVRNFGSLAASRLGVLAGLLPSILPISFGYLLAHNTEYVAINGQLLVPLLGNPTGLEGTPFFHGQWLPAPFNDSYVVNFNLVSSAVAWYADVVVIIGVHIIAVVLAHRFAGAAARTTQLARRSEYPWIVAMVGYTMTSLWLLAQPLVEQAAPSAFHSTTQVAAHSDRDSS